MHTQLSNTHLAWWISFVLTQGILATIPGRWSTLRIYLASECFIGATLIILAKTINAWSYFTCWIAASFLHEGLGALLCFGILYAVRRRGLPSRQARWPITLAIGISFFLGIYNSSDAFARLATMKDWQLCLSWDHAFWSSICCLLAFIPFYAWCISATFPAPLTLTLSGLGIHAISQTKLLDHIILKHSLGIFLTVNNLSYLLSLLLWMGALPATERLIHRMTEKR